MVSGFAKEALKGGFRSFGASAKLAHSLSLDDSHPFKIYATNDVEPTVGQSSLYSVPLYNLATPRLCA